MYFELMCDLIFLVLIPVAFPYLIEKRVWNEIKIRFSKYYDIFYIFI